MHICLSFFTNLATPLARIKLGTKIFILIRLLGTFQPYMFHVFLNGQPYSLPSSFRSYSK